MEPDVKLRRFGASNWYALPRGIPQDDRLSAEGLAVMVYLLSKPDDWDARPGDIRRRFEWGRDKWQGVAAHLETCGYLRRVKERDNGGRFLHFVEYADHPAFAPLPENTALDTATVFAVAGSAVAGSAVAGKHGSVHDTEGSSDREKQERDEQPPAPLNAPFDTGLIPEPLTTTQLEMDALRATIVLLTGETGQTDWKMEDLVSRQVLACHTRHITPEQLREFAIARPGKIKLRFLVENFGEWQTAIKLSRGKDDGNGIDNNSARGNNGSNGFQSKNSKAANAYLAALNSSAA